MLDYSNVDQTQLILLSDQATNDEKTVAQYNEMKMRQNKILAG